MINENIFSFPRMIAMPVAQVEPCEALLKAFNTKHRTEHITIDKMLLEVFCEKATVKDIGADIRKKEKKELEARWFDDEMERVEWQVDRYGLGLYDKINSTNR